MIPQLPHPRCAVRTAAVLVALIATPALGQSKTFELSPSGWQQVKEAPPGSDQAVVNSAREALAAGDATRALEILDLWIEENETTKKPELAEAYLVRGDAYVADEDEFKALYDYEQVVRDYGGSEFFVRALERELEVAKMYLGGLRKKSLGIFRIDSGIPLAEEIIMRINERLPGSRLAERALMMLADYYYEERDLRMAAETYDVFVALFPRSDQRKKALQRRIYANIAQFKGPNYDASGLIEARFQIMRYQAEFPLDAEQAGMSDALIARLDESGAQELLEESRWYERRGDPPSQRFTLQRLIREHPNSGAAKIAADVLASKQWGTVAEVRNRSRRAATPEAPPVPPAPSNGPGEERKQTSGGGQ